MSDNDDLADELAAFLGTIPSLVSVIPIARTIRSPGGLPLLVESITVFSTGGTIRYSLVGVDMASDVLPWEGITWALADDLGTEYQTQGGGGGGGETIMTMHADFHPAPPADATSLLLSMGAEVIPIDLTRAVAAT